MASRKATAMSKPPEDIAIIGMSCVFPAADGLAAYWANLLAGVDAVSEPSPAWDSQRYLANGSISTASGGFLKDLFRFDSVELGIMPNAVDGGEPDQFLALRVAREALADAGYLGDAHDHTSTGVILGHSTYLHRGNANVVQHGVVVDQTLELVRKLVPRLTPELLERLGTALRSQLPPFNADIAPGLVPNVMTGRIANRLNLRGPNYLIDAACASSLLAVQAAVEELRSGRSDLMMAGGVNASLPPEVYMVFSQLGALSRSGKVRSFSDAADGTLLGEGLGVVVLKRRSDAVRDGDRIYAVVKGVGQSSDGKGLGLLAPNLEGEALAIRRAYRNAKIEPSCVGLIEMHGTGIPLGDRTEIAALGSVLGARNGVPDCAVGSVKSMIGHCIPAAGIAGLIKAALALYYRVLPPTLCDRVSDALGIEKTPLYVNTAPRPWIQPLGRPRHAAVNAFGFGGVNSHAVLAESEDQGEARPPSWPAELAVFAGADRDELIGPLGSLIAAHGEGRLKEVPLARLALHLGQTCGSGPLRLAIVASDVTDLVAKAERALARLERSADEGFQSRNGIYFSPRPAEGRLAFVFPGEGAQYQGMLDDVLMCFPEARQWFDFWDTVFENPDARRSAHVYPPPTTLDAATAASLKDGLFGLEIGSESMFVASQALLAVLDRLGLRPDAVVGHSSGENSALLAAQAVECHGWAELGHHIHHLNRVYREIGSSVAPDDGTLVTVGAVERGRLLDFVDGINVQLALDNCNHQSVLYGQRPVMERVVRELGQEGGLCTFLPFDRPYHTPLFEPVVDAIAGIYDNLRFRAPATPIYSCASAAPFPHDPAEMRRLALKQWSSRVRFTETIERMYDDGFRCFVEVGPSSNLTGFIDDVLSGQDHLAVSLDSQRRSSLTQLLSGLGRIWAQGRDVALDALFDERGLVPFDPAEPAPVPRRYRVVPNTLPYASVSDEDVASIRSAMEEAAPADAPPPMRCGPASPPAEPASPRLDPLVGGDRAPEACDDGPRPGVAGSITSQHFELMREFLASQERIMAAVLGGPRPDAAGGSLPFVHRVLALEEGSAEAICELRVERDRFLLHHVLYARQVSDLDPGLHGLAVVPLAVSMEMVAEIAAIVAELPRLARLEDVRVHDWVALDDGVRVLMLRAVRIDRNEAEERIAASIVDGDATLFEATVVFAEAPSELVRHLPPLAAPRAPIWRDEDLYTSGMFHGPLFQSIANLLSWDETGLDVRLHDTPLDGFFTPGAEPTLLLNPALLDAIGHVTAFWIAQHMGTDFSSFPSQIARIEFGGAEREDTEGAILGGRLEFPRGEGAVEYLSGNFECVAADGAVLFRATGWRDRFFQVPNRFFFARFRPREGWYGDERTALFPAAPDGAVVWHLPAFPPHFLGVSGAIWTRVLAHTVLSRDERAEWAALPDRPKRRADWLIGRLAIKEAVRCWVERAHGVLLLPADVNVAVDEKGKPFVTGLVWEELGRPPQVSVSHAGGQAVAVAAPSATPVGVDIEPVGRVVDDELLLGAFTEGERALIEGGADRTLRLLRAWCAKEAAAKCLGEGLNGRPRQFVVAGLGDTGQPQVASVTALGREVRVSFAVLDGSVLALAAPADLATQPEAGVR